jgi:hypothetical protein
MVAALAVTTSGQPGGSVDSTDSKEVGASRDEDGGDGDGNDGVEQCLRKPPADEFSRASAILGLVDSDEAELTRELEKHARRFAKVSVEVSVVIDRTFGGDRFIDRMNQCFTSCCSHRSN